MRPVAVGLMAILIRAAIALGRTTFCTASRNAA